MRNILLSGYWNDCLDVRKNGGLPAKGFTFPIKGQHSDMREHYKIKDIFFIVIPQIP